MTCNRCYDIHEAQKLGNTQQPCKCTCHKYSYSTGGNITWTDLTSTSSTIDCNSSSCVQQSDSSIPKVFTGIENCSCITSSRQCDDCKETQCLTFGCKNTCNEINTFCTPCNIERSRLF